MKNTIIAAVTVSLIVSGIVAGVFTEKVTIDKRETVNVGAQVGPEHTEAQYFRGGVTVGGLNNLATSSTESTFTLTPSFVNYKIPYVAWNAGINTTLTLPNATTSSFGGMRVGESFEQVWYSATTTAATTITFAAPAGGGIDLQEPELDGTVILNGLEFAIIRYIKTGAATVSVITDISQIGD